MNLHVVAYPELLPADREVIQVCRKEYNTLYNVIGAHLTLVFSVPDMNVSDFIAEVKKQVQGTKAIDLVFRSVIINKDSFSDYFDAFLVPDEGSSRVVKLHDRLYSEKLAYQHRADISYIPHISLANSLDVRAIKKIADEWNARDFEIKGRITSLDIINYENRVITTLEKVYLE
jgi:hypothetical protein